MHSLLASGCDSHPTTDWRINFSWKRRWFKLSLKDFLASIFQSNNQECSICLFLILLPRGQCLFWKWLMRASLKNKRGLWEAVRCMFDWLELGCTVLCRFSSASLAMAYQRLVLLAGVHLWQRPCSQQMYVPTPLLLGSCLQHRAWLTD